jgi:hypothetical protein
MEQAVTAGQRRLTAGPGAPKRGQRLADLPSHILKELNDKLVGGTASRPVSEWLHKQGYKFSHNAVAEYNREKLQPALRLGAKLAAMQSDTPTTDHPNPDQLSAVRKLTNEVLTAQPLIDQKNELMREVLGGIKESKGEKPDLRARASLITAGRGLIETEAKLLGVGGFGAQQNSGGTVVQIAVMAAQPHSAEMPIIDVQIAEVGRRDG